MAEDQIGSQAGASSVSLPVGVVLRRSPGATAWAQWIWRAVAVIPGAGPAEGRLLRAEGDEGAPHRIEERHVATTPLELHRTDTEAYLVGLAAAPPVVYVVLRSEGDDAAPVVHCVTASPYEAQDYADSGEELVEPVAAPPDLVAWIAAFAEQHHRDEPFKKRRRNRVRTELKEDGVGDPRVRQPADIYRAPGALKPKAGGEGGA
ncbi:MAG: DUF3305 domain-containing protein [Neomegalonema sp.]|nr:DUF3305 domain-containing protein [Neomegalonema sp.]